MANGGKVVLDGGTGTEIQRMGTAMDDQFWCAEANKHSPDIVRLVHDRYLEAGSEVITANTYATSPLLYDAYGQEGDVAELDRAAVEIAKSAASAVCRSVCVAGSVSIMRPPLDAVEAQGLKFDWSRAEAQLLFEHKAQSLADAGCDLILMEMMRDDFYSVIACEAALATGIPVWIGLSAWREDRHSTLCGWERTDMPFDMVCETLAALQPHAMGIMHTELQNIDEAISSLRRVWDGPRYVYPELGHFEMPNWVYNEDLTPTQFSGIANTWIDDGAFAVGGCCGLGPDHIKAFADSISL